jgi:hypothetical protein
VAALIVGALLLITSAPGRGVAGALAGFTKFAPLGLGPLFMRGVGGVPRARSLIWYVVAYAVTSVVVLLPVLLDGNFGSLWHDAVIYQAKRPAPFSIWGLWGGLSFERYIVMGAAVALALGVALIPGKRTLVEVAALGAAVVIAVQLTLDYWFYLYIVWFFPMVMLALFGSYPERAIEAATTEPSSAALPIGPGSALPVASPG